MVCTVIVPANALFLVDQQKLVGMKKGISATAATFHGGKEEARFCEMINGILIACNEVPFALHRIMFHRILLQSGWGVIQGVHGEGKYGHILPGLELMLDPHQLIGHFGTDGLAGGEEKIDHTDLTLHHRTGDFVTVGINQRKRTDGMIHGINDIFPVNSFANGILGTQDFETPEFIAAGL